MSDLIASLQQHDIKAVVQTQGRWCAVFPEWPAVGSPGFFGVLQSVTAWQREVAPWALVDIAQSPAFVVASDFTWLNRIRCWWLNISRRHQARQHAAYVARRLEQGQLAAQWAADRAIETLLQQTNREDAPRA